MSVKQNLFVSVFVHKCLMMFNDVEYTAFKMFVTEKEQLSLCYFFSINVCFIKHCVIVKPEPKTDLAEKSIQFIQTKRETSSA